MIKRELYLAAAGIAEELSGRGLAIKPKAGSLISDLIESSCSVNTVKTTDLPSVLANPAVHAGRNTLVLDVNDRASSVECTTADWQESSLHSKKVAALADDISKFVLSHVSFARNTVKPAVVQFTKDLHEFVQTAKPIDPSTEIKIVKGVLPALVQDESILERLKGYIGRESKYPESVMFDPLPDEDFAAIVSMGSNRLQELADDWVKKLEPGFIKKVFEAFFAYRGDGSYNYADIYERLDMNLAAYFISVFLLTNVRPSDVKNLATYKMRMADKLDYYGTEVTKCLSTITRQVQANTLVSGYNARMKTIVVHQPVYAAYLEAGGRPEVLLGMASSGNIQYNLSAILQQAESFDAAWRVYLSVAESKNRAYFHGLVSDFIVNKISADMAELTEAEQAKAAGTGVEYRKKVLEIVRGEIKHLGHRLLDDLDHTALHVVARGRFYFTAAYDILNEMVQVQKANPDIDPREASLLAVADYFAEYLVSQIDVSKLQ